MNKVAMNYEMKVIREVGSEADDFYQDAANLGSYAARAFQTRDHSKKNNRRSQMTSLENIAESTFKTSDIFDYIKKQTARHDYWRQVLPGFSKANQGFGESLREYLEKDLVERRNAVCDRLKVGDSSYEDKQERRRIYLLLIRQFVRSVVVMYEYRLNPVLQENGGKE